MDETWWKENEIKTRNHHIDDIANEKKNPFLMVTNNKQQGDGKNTNYTHRVISVQKKLFKTANS